MLIIGLTGGIGTGKTAVTTCLRSLGAHVIDADRVGHEAYMPYTDTWREVVNTFGEEILTPESEIDRKTLGGIVFSDPEALKLLNSIMHPRIYRMIEEQLEKLTAKSVELTVLEAALLVEAGWSPLCHEIWVITTPEQESIRRVQKRSGLDKESIRSRIRAQMPQSERVTHADTIIQNDGSIRDLTRQVELLWNSRILAGKEQKSSA